MKRLSIVFVWVFLFGFSANAQLLWKITGADIKKPSYLFVTHNFIPISYLDSIPNLFKLYGNCDVVACEMALNNVDDMTRIQRAAIMPDRTTIADLLNLEDFTMVDNELKTITPMGLTEFARLHPALILTLYQTELFKKTTGFMEGTQSDSYFQLIAVQQNKKVFGLETAEQQISVLLGNKPLEQQAKLLADAVLQKDSIIVDMRKETKMYKSGDIETLSNLLKQREQVRYLSIEEYEQQLKQRNILWTAQLAEIINAAPCFITVSAQHLPNRFGLINLLREKGYSVKGM